MAAAVEQGRPWQAERLLNTLSVQTDPDVAAARARVAEALSDPVLAEARRLAAGDDPAALGRLLSRAFEVEAAVCVALRPAQESRLVGVLAKAGALPAWAEIKGRQAPGRQAASVSDVAAGRADWASRKALASALTEELRYDEAEAALKSWVAECPDVLSRYGRLCAFYRRIGDVQGWAECLAECERRFPDDPWVHAQRLQWRLEAREPIDLDRMATALSASPPLDVLAATVAVPHLLANQHFEQAVTLQSAIVAHRDQPFPLYMLALGLFQAGRAPEAISALETGLVQFPGDARFRLRWAQVKERQGDYAAALSAYAQTLALAPNDVNAVSGIPRCLSYLGRHNDALSWLAEFPVDDITWGWTHALRAFALAHQGRTSGVAGALAPLYRLGAEFRTRVSRMRAEDPSLVWKDGRFVRHPHAGWPAAARRWGEIVDRLANAQTVIVGNAPTLLGSSLGERIDAFDEVMRLNDFRTRGFERDVGSKTTLWHTSANKMANPGEDEVRGVDALIYQPSAYHFPDLAAFTHTRFGFAVPSDTGLFLPPPLHVVSERLVYPRPSTGFRAITAMEFLGGREFSATGFDFFEGDALNHYFMPNETRVHVGEVHAIAFERDFMDLVLKPHGHVTVLQ